jgi:hypothetical protein
MRENQVIDITAAVRGEARDRAFLLKLRIHSRRNATTGSTFVVRRAGMQPDSSVTANNNTVIAT